MRTLFILLLTLAIGFSGCKKSDPAPENTTNKSATSELEPLVKRPDPSMDPVQARIFKTNVSEDIVLDLTPRFKILANAFQGKTANLDDLFAPDVDYLGISAVDLTEALKPGDLETDQLVAHFKWPLAESAEGVSDIGQQLWAPLLSKFKFEDTQFGVTEGVLQENEDVFHMKTVFEGRFRDEQNRVFGVKAKQTLDWRPINDEHWKITRWHQDKLELIATEKQLFEDVTPKLFDKKSKDILTRSKHEEMLLERAKSLAVEQTLPKVVQYFTDWHSLFQYTSASVVDLDGDNWDDLFVTDRFGETMLFRNRGDNTFEDVSFSSGLKLMEAMANCAIFADFDNDGDSDVFIGRTLHPCLYFRNDDGKFIPDSEVNKELDMVRFVTAASAADVNGDGLLDLYLSTYATRGGSDFNWIQYAVPPGQQGELFDYIRRSHAFLNRHGPPNILLMNKGGKLKPVKISPPLQQWRNSFQSVWTDFDDDGDPDLYLCNDFAPDVFLRNDTKKGSFVIRFNNVTDEVFVGNTMGFGMGANFGDYNSDGKLDLYVSNMYSKAGHRVIEHFDGDVDPRIDVSSRGNFLYRNIGGKFEHVAGLEEGKQQVAKVGWSFGGQMADFNNDGKLDVYVPSGFFTAPESIAIPFDL